MDLAAQDVYLVVNHRNHIGIMSSGSVNSSIENESEIDFTASADASHGSGSVTSETLATIGTVYAMIAGDANNDGQARGNDETSTIAPSFGGAGYHNGDINFDQQIRGNDVTSTLEPNFGKGIQFDTVLNLDSRLTRSARPAANSDVVCWSSSP